jgi:1-acyl-sn-glycerol-3-phosphate acyltransferase
MGYVAKDEWRKLKPLAKTILYSRSVFLTRGDAREAVKTIKEASDILSMGFNLVIFPEGTRSQCHEMGEFKSGAFKFAEKGKVPILPVTVDGGYHLLEEKGTYQPTTVKITVHPLVHIEEMDKHAQKQAAENIEAAIRSAL